MRMYYNSMIIQITGNGGVTSYALYSNIASTLLSLGICQICQHILKHNRQVYYASIMD